MYIQDKIKMNIKTSMSFDVIIKLSPEVFGKGIKDTDVTCSVDGSPYASFFSFLF